MRKLPALMALMLIGAAATPGLAREAPAPASLPETVEGLAPMAADDLQAVNGQGVEAVLLSEQQLAATSSGNSVTATTIRSGDVNFAGALSSFSGVGNFVVNTGNNNNLQGAISVNIITTPAP